MRKLTGLCLLLLLGASPVFAQSLGAVAKKERERREKNKKEGVSAQEFTEEEVFGPADEESEAEVELESSEDVPSDAGAESGDRLGSEMQAGSSGDADSERESRERRRSEVEWRSRVHSARARIETAKKRRASLDGLNLSVGEYYVDAQGRTVIQSLEHLQRLVREADEEVVAAEAALKDLLEEARRAGVPPGWLR